MKIDFLKPLSDFQYSINLEYDLFDNDKVKGFLPTNGSLVIIEDILLSAMTKSSRRARLLTGSYGKGKSHMTLALLALLENRDQKLFDNMLKKAKSFNLDLYNNIKQYLESGKKLFPVVVRTTTTTNDLRANLLNSLQVALDSYNFKDLMPETFFNVAVASIQSWKENYPLTYKAFKESIEVSVETFIKKLESFDRPTYNKFIKIYPSLTSGSSFNPVQGADVISLYNNVIKDLRAYGYNGIFLVYDEFGKFLEGSIDTSTTANDLKLLQELAERSNRSELDEQLHLLLISHKGIDNYVSNLTKEKTDNWKAIEGRFEKISIQNTASEIYELIAQVLKKDKEKYNQFYEINKKYFNNLEKVFSLKDNMSGISKGGAFTNILKSLNEDIVKQCYPLHPYSLLMLPKISELVAQNERSIFTFLAGSDKNTVIDYIKKSKEEFPIIEPDLIYDYFESAFLAQPFGSFIREQWQITSAAIAKLNAYDKPELAIKILKTLALIYIINEFETLPPSKDVIGEIYSSKYLVSDVPIAFNLIKQAELLIELEFKPHVKIRNSSQNNLEQLIEDEISRVSRDFSPKLILQEAMTTEYFYPTEYNDTFEIIRYFRFVFLEYEEFVSIENINRYIDNIESDGVILAILLKDEFEKEKALEKIKYFNQYRLSKNEDNIENRDRIVYILPKFPKLITEKLKKYAAILSLEAKNKADTVLLDELQYIKVDLEQLINAYIDKQYFKSELQESEYYYEGKLQSQVKSRRSFSALLSEICKTVYSKTPKIINENINRNEISSPMAGARLRIITNILDDHPKANLGLTGSQDINVMRSVYVVPEIIKDVDAPKFDLIHCNSDFKNLFEIIEGYLVGSFDKVVNFSILYDRLTHARHGIGLKRGVIPFYLALILRKYKGYIVIIRGKREYPLNAQLLIDINEKPQLYSYRAENLTPQKSKYLNDLEAMFSGYGSFGDTGSNFDNVVRTIQSWYTYLPKFNREASIIYNDDLITIPNSNEHTQFKRQLGYPELNAREFLFEKLPSIFNTSSYEDICKKAKKIKREIENNISNALRFVVQCLDKIFNRKVKSSLRSTLLDYYESLTERTKNNLFDGDAESLMRIFKRKTDNEIQIANDLVKELYGLRINDLKPELIDDIEDKIKTAKDTIDRFNSKFNENTSLLPAMSTITYINENGEEKIIHIDDMMSEDNYATGLLENEIDTLFKEYGDSINKYDKAKLLLKKIKELLD